MVEMPVPIMEEHDALPMNSVTSVQTLSSLHDA